MGRFLFTMMFTNDLGLPNRTVPIALELQNRGHEVAFCNPEAAPKRLLAEAGLRNFDHLERRYPTVLPPFMQPFSMDHFYSLFGYLDEELLRGECEDLIEVATNFAADVIVDSWGLTGCLAARVLRKPLVSILQADMHPAGPNFIWWKDAPTDLPTPVPGVNRLLAEHDLPAVARTNDVHVGDVTLIAGIPETEPLPEGADVTYVGPILYQKPDAKLPDYIDSLDPGTPLLWVYTATPRYFDPFVTIGDSVIVMRACIEALAGEDLHVILTTGYRDLPGDVGSLPANFHYETYVPGLLMAERADLIVHHGGHGATMTAPYCGTPAVIIPTFSERESNARRMAGLGAAEIVFPTEDEELEKHVSADEVRAKIRQVLSDPSYADNARWVGERMRQYGGATQAVDLIERFATRLIT